MQYIKTIFFVFLLILFSKLHAQLSFSFLDTKTIGATDFISQNPKYDGRNVVIIILDTGVDMGVSGLQSLPDGTPKVIDVQDFSGEGDVYFQVAKLKKTEREWILSDENGNQLYGLEHVKSSPVDSAYYMGILREEQFKNSGLSDLNRNNRTDDLFGFIVYKSDSGWVSFIDLDGDTHIDDEVPLYSYKKKNQSFQFRNSQNKGDKKFHTFALNIFPEENRVNFHYDGSGHGTHVAGIAAGYKINGQDALNGIAPGAKIISLKIGDNRLSGGATTTGSMMDAYEYGIEFAKSYPGPVVFNMSFGIGSEWEGFSRMEQYLNNLALENPDVAFCLSAGNEGPGISSVGLPASSRQVISVGALNSRQSARDLYGANLRDGKIFVFSSRGGEVDKPDVIAPGGAASTVPPTHEKDVMWGTSMASPQVAGAVALLLSAASQQNPPLPVHAALIKKALKNSAKPLPDYLPVDQGTGVVQIPRAFDYYKKYVESGRAEPYSYRIQTIDPVRDRNDASAIYWRVGGYTPDVDHKQVVSVYADFATGTDQEKINSFYRAFELESSAPWLKINKKNIYIKGDEPASLEVHFDRKKMPEPGIYSARISAYRKGGLFSINSHEDIEFGILASAIVPYKLDETNHYHIRKNGLRIDPGDLQRIFFEVPAQASAVVASLKSAGNSFAKIRGYLFDPQGRELPQSLWLNSQHVAGDQVYLSRPDLQKGIYELVLYADFRNEKQSMADVVLEASYLNVFPSVISELTMQNGENPTGRLKVSNISGSLFEGYFDGAIQGIRRERQLNSMDDYIEVPFTVDDYTDRVQFELELPEAIFNLLTDFAINVKDISNRTLKAESLTYKKITFEFYPENSGDYYLELIPAFADPQPSNWSARLRESYFAFTPTKISGNSFISYPGTDKLLEFEVFGQIRVAPQDYQVFGELVLKRNSPEGINQRIPILLDTSLQKPMEVDQKAGY